MERKPLLFQQELRINREFLPDASIVLWLGDTLEFLRTVPDKTVALVVSSPPYNVGKEYEIKTEIEHYLDNLKPIVHEMHRVLRDDGSLCWNVGNYANNGEIFPLDIFFYPIFKSLGMKLRNRAIWHVGHGVHETRRFSGRYETLSWFTKSAKYTFNLDAVRVPSKYPGKRSYKGANRGKPSGNPLGKNPSDVWEIVARDWETGLWNVPNVKAAHPEKTAHPAQFPIEVVERCVMAFTNENEWVLDPFAGAGSALIAALKHGRRAMGADKEPSYVKIAEERIRDFQNGVLPIRPLGRAIYVPGENDKVARPPKEWVKGEVSSEDAANSEGGTLLS